MNVERTETHSKSFTLISVTIFVLAVGVTAWFRLFLLPYHFLTLSYSLPLLLCLWHRDRRLLWSMSVAFAVMAIYKVICLGPDPADVTKWDIAQGSMHVFNLLVVSVAVDTIVRLMRRLRQKNAQLATANEELLAREEEITRQNEELSSQAEELAQQNEEIHAQAEEASRQNEQLQQQSEELQAQTEELQVTNSELAEREFLLHTLIECVREKGSDRNWLDRICESVVKLFGDRACAAAVFERRGDHMIARACFQVDTQPETQLPIQNTLAMIVMGEQHTGSIDDLSKRPDIFVLGSPQGSFRALIAAPFFVEGKPAGTVEVYSRTPQQWTTRHFDLIDWVATQCSLVLEARYLRRAMVEANVRLEKTVQERTAELQELIDELEHFSYTITHDMRAPLRAMQGFASILKEDFPNVPAEAAVYLENINNSARRMDRLITDALDYSKAVRQEIVGVPVNIHKLLSEMLPAYPLFQPPHARIEIIGDVPTVLANEAGLTQCISNLLDNAVKFAKPGQQPHVKIRAECRDGFARIWFEDNGVGIPLDFQPKVFEMFQRGTKAHEGTGIGLALVRKVVERMGGRAGCESEPGIGSRFWIELKPAT